LPDGLVLWDRVKPSPFGALAVVLIRKKNGRAAPFDQLRLARFCCTAA